MQGFCLYLLKLRGNTYMKQFKFTKFKRENEGPPFRFHKGKHFQQTCILVTEMRPYVWLCVCVVAQKLHCVLHCFLFDSIAWTIFHDSMGLFYPSG